MPACEASARKSSSDPIPPDAITLRPCFARELAVREMSGPLRVPSRATSVYKIAATGTSAKLAREIDGARFGDRRPTVGRDHAVFRVDRDDHAFGELFAQCTYHFALAECRGAEDDALCAARDVTLERFARSHAAADLHASFSVGPNAETIARIVALCTHRPARAPSRSTT